MSECVMLTQIKDLEHQLDAAQSQCIISENKVNKIKESITLLRQKVSNSKATKLMVFSLLNRHHSSWGWFSTHHWITFSFKTYELTNFSVQGSILSKSFSKFGPINRIIAPVSRSLTPTSMKKYYAKPHSSFCNTYVMVSFCIKFICLFLF